MDSALVVKVKYGDTLRRFTAYTDETGLLDLDMCLLKQKIHSFFNFASDANLNLIYIDEDGDMVTLVDDEDLCEAISQSLNPLRINVSLNDTRAKRSKFRLKISSSPKGSCHVRRPLSPTDSGNVERALKCFPEPISDVFFKKSVELVTKATSLVLIQFVDYLSKLQSSHLGSILECHDGKQDGEEFTSECSRDSKVTEDLESKDMAKRKPLSGEIEETMKENFHEEKETENASAAVGNSFLQDPPGKVVSTVNLQEDSASSGCLNLNRHSPVSKSDTLFNLNKKNAKEEECAHHSWKSANFDSSLYLANSFVPIQASTAPITQGPNFAALNSDGAEIAFNPNTQTSSSQIASKPCDSASKNNSCSGNTIFRVFHKGIRCDGCGMYPIVGPRFKSKVKEDYDLCNICFSDMGTMVEYIRLDHPVSHQSPRLLKKKSGSHSCLKPNSLLRNIQLQGSDTKPYLLMFDSLFVKDVSLMCGTVMAPNVPCIKIWKMRNVGTAPWPCGTQLVWTGGYQFTDQVSVRLKIPIDGFPVGEDLDIAVTFTTPEKLGQHISFWQMSLPSGEQFGEHVTIIIKVDTSLESSTNTSYGFNLNLPA